MITNATCCYYCYLYHYHYCCCCCYYSYYQGGQDCCQYCQYYDECHGPNRDHANITPSTETAINSNSFYYC